MQRKIAMTKKEKKVLSATGKVENEDGKMKIVFEPGCFDHIDVANQEELDAIMAEIQDMFANMTPEELEAQSRPLTDEEIEEMDDDEREAVLQALAQANDREARKNRLN
jgi:hypothetical protein